jgi:nucleotide-binding universal stress UspA family protein
MSGVPGYDGPRIVLVAVDGSETSLRAGAYAAGLARRQHSRLVCLYVRTISALVAASPAALSAMRETFDSVSAELRQNVEVQAQHLGIDAVFVEREGNPFTEIVRLADELLADAVIIGASSKAGHRFVGSLAVHLVKVAHWPVTVVP